MTPAHLIPEYCRAKTLVLGCGNILFGDDGFGPTAVEYLQEKFPIPADMCVINAGLSVREILFTLALSSQRPEQIIVVDAMDVGRTPGEVFELDLADIPAKKIDDFSMHQLPTSNLLRELKELCGVDVTIISAQVEAIPESVCPGLSQTLVEALPAACKMILERGVG